MAYIAVYNSKLHPFKETTSEDNKSPTSYPLLGLLGADLEVLTRQIRLGLGSNPTVSEHRHMFYMLAHDHH